MLSNFLTSVDETLVCQKATEKYNCNQGAPTCVRTVSYAVQGGYNF